MNPKLNVEELHQCSLSISMIADEMLNDYHDEATSLFAISSLINEMIAKIYELYDIPVPKEDDIPF